MIAAPSRSEAQRSSRLACKPAAAQLRNGLTIEDKSALPYLDMGQILPSQLGTLERGTDAPLYQQIADRLSDLMAAGVLATGDLLPSTPELSHHFGVALMTVRQALDLLRKDSRIVSVKGKGIYVGALPRLRAAMNPMAEVRRGPLRIMVDRTSAYEGLMAARRWLEKREPEEPFVPGDQFGDLLFSVWEIDHELVGVAGVAFVRALRDECERASQTPPRWEEVIDGLSTTTAPSGSFDAIADEILTRIRSSDLTLIAGAGGANGA